MEALKRDIPHQTLARIHGTLIEFLEPRRGLDPSAILNMGFPKLSSMITELCDDYQLQTLVDYEELAKYYRANSEGYPATARPPAPPGTKWQITIMGDSTWNWKSTTKVDGLKAQHEVTSIPRKMNQLRATTIPLDMPSTQLLCKATSKSRKLARQYPACRGTLRMGSRGQDIGLGGQRQLVDPVEPKGAHARRSQSSR
jgi:hypothetical protein